jgi:Family of unknown function (DUF5677)
VKESKLTKDEGARNEAFWAAINNFTRHVNGMLWNRWKAWPDSHEDRDSHEVIGALLSRQVTLTVELAGNAGIWNDHLAPLVLRPMVEGLITLSWILGDPTERSRRFILYGLGQEKLLLEHEKVRLAEEGIDPDEDQTIQQWESWLNAQRRTDLTEVNVGNWAEVTPRDMAKEAGHPDWHHIDYARWSGATHNMWHHLVRFNLQHCQNALHGFHRVPLVSRLIPNPDYLRWAAEYLDMTFALFDEKIGVHMDGPSAIAFLDQELQQLP